MSDKRSKIELTQLDELFTTQDKRDDLKLERILELPVSDLKPFKFHPFKVNEDDELQKMMESIQKYGVLVPALARPVDGGYELVSGHRRKMACELLGIDTMPVIVREMSDDQAVILMVDSNLHREHILPSEKAFAYKMKLDALKHQGKSTYRQVGEKLLSVEIVGDKVNESARQVHRYIRLTELIPELLEKMDLGEISLSPAVELSYLTPEQQTNLLEQMERNDCTPSHAQSIRLKKLSLDGALSPETISTIMTEEKPNQKEQIRLPKERFSNFFPREYTAKQIEDKIYDLLRAWQRRRDNSRDER